MSTISLRLTDEETELFKSYAELKKMSLSEMVRSAVYERMEDEFDLKAFDKAMAEYRKNPVTYTHDEVRGMLDLG